MLEKLLEIVPAFEESPGGIEEGHDKEQIENVKLALHTTLLPLLLFMFRPAWGISYYLFAAFVYGVVYREKREKAAIVYALHLSVLFLFVMAVAL